MKKMNRKRVTASSILTAAVVSSAIFLPGCNPSVYGPPPDYDPENNVQEDVYGPPSVYEPEDNVLEDVYGPPEDFEEPADQTEDGEVPQNEKD